MATHRPVLIVALVAGVAASLAACGSSGSSPSTTGGNAAKAPAKTAAAKTVKVELKEFTITPDTPSAPAGNVTFVATDSGKVPHEFIVIRTNKPAAGLLKGSTADEAGAVGEIPEFAAGTTKKLTLRLARGHYAFICNLPGHYAAGQHTDFTVK